MMLRIVSIIVLLLISILTLTLACCGQQACIVLVETPQGIEVWSEDGELLLEYTPQDKPEYQVLLDTLIEAINQNEKRELEFLEVYQP